jgi:hypothetical protein
MWGLMTCLLLLLLLLLLSITLGNSLTFQRITIIFVYSKIFYLCFKDAETKLYKCLKAMKLDRDQHKYFINLGRDVSFIRIKYLNLK